MSARAFDPLRLDVKALAKDAAEITGHWPLRLFTRLVEAVHPESPLQGSEDVAWRAQGEQGAARGVQPRTRLHLTAATRLHLECQRCLRPVEAALDVDRWFLFVEGEEAAAQIDVDSDDDVLAFTRALDLRELVEDELLLALPLVPRHAVCPSPLPTGVVNGGVEQGKPNPFAALAALKRGDASG